jgi:hypothetical protein
VQGRSRLLRHHIPSSNPAVRSFSGSEYPSRRSPLLLWLVNSRLHFSLCPGLRVRPRVVGVNLSPRPSVLVLPRLLHRLEPAGDSVVSQAGRDFVGVEPHLDDRLGWQLLDGEPSSRPHLPVDFDLGLPSSLLFRRLWPVNFIEEPPASSKPSLLRPFHEFLELASHHVVTRVGPDVGQASNRGVRLLLRP